MTGSKPTTAEGLRVKTGGVQKVTYAKSPTSSSLVLLRVGKLKRSGNSVGVSAKGLPGGLPGADHGADSGVQFSESRLAQTWPRSSYRQPPGKPGQRAGLRLVPPQQVSKAE